MDCWERRGRVTRRRCTPDDPAAAAARAEGLRYVSDREPGISRERHGRTFIYRDSRARRILAPGELARIRALAIPPAYTHVWICASANGHLQATGRDARGRKQYRYHPRWRTHRDSTKFHRMLAFGRALPRIRRRVAQHLLKTGLPREKVLATLVKLLERTLVRGGHEEYARENGSYGLTTLRGRHVRVSGERLIFEFRGKSGVYQRVAVSDPAVARVVRRCQDLPGQELFQWVDEKGRRHTIDSSDVNEYLREICGEDFTAKDFRTWFATVEALERLRRLRPASAREAQHQAVEVVREVARRLGNTPSVCRNCYIHPGVIEAHARGALTAVNGAAPAQVLAQLLRAPRPGIRVVRRGSVPRRGSGAGRSSAGGRGKERARAGLRPRRAHAGRAHSSAASPA